MSKLKVEVDKEKCIGCGSCVAICPDYFAMEGDKAKVIESKVDDNECVKEAQASCPVAAIIVEES